MLLSATIVFFPLVSIGGIEISIKSKVFIAKLDKYIEELRITSKKMKETSDLIEYVAETIYKTDLDVEEKIKQL